jgi:hypothetical protein
MLEFVCISGIVGAVLSGTLTVYHLYRMGALFDVHQIDAIIDDAQIIGEGDE